MAAQPKPASPANTPAPASPAPAVSAAPAPKPPAPSSDEQMLKRGADAFAKLREQIGGVIVGQDATVRALLAAVFAQGHVLVVGVPGLAKTLLVRTLADALGWSFKRIQFTPDMMPADIIGMEILQEVSSTPDPSGRASGGGRREMRFVHGPIFANLVLADEINRTPPKTQSALLEAMQEYTVTSMGRSYALDRPFIVVATQNPIEQAGTYPLPEAQLDRFMFSLWMDYPSQAEEERVVMATTTEETPRAKAVLTKDDLLAIQSLVRRVPVSEHVVRYAVSIARATRPTTAPTSNAGDTARQYVEWGAGPRAAQHMVLAGKALAVMDGRPTVSTQHIRQAAPLVLRHRVLPNYTAAGEGVTAQQIVDRVLKDVPETGEK